MRRILYLAAIALGLGTTANVLAQGGGMGGGGGGSSFGGGSGGSSFGGGSGGSTFGGGSGGSSFSGGSGGSSFSGGSGGNSFTGGGTQSFTGGTGGSTGGGAGGRTGGTGTGTTFTPSTTGVFAKYYSNPLYPGRPGSTNISNKTVGGFGQPSFGTATASTQRSTAGQTGRTGTTNRNQNSSNQANIAPITYAMEVKFQAPIVAPARLQTDLQSLLGRSASLRSAGNVRIEVAGTVVILRGRVADDDERRLVEGMVRMEPGVREVQNELTVP